MPPPLRLAVLGVGRMGAFHARTLAGLDEIDVVAVVDPVVEVVHAVAEEIGATAHDSPAAVTARDQVDAWLIATPTPTHPALVREALTAGIDVLCEKPLALDLGEGQRLGELAADTGRVVQIGFWRRFSPPWLTAKRLVDAGAIGRPLMVRLAQWDADPPPAAFCDPEVSGGLAIDCGVHEYDLAEWFTGRRVASVTARNLPLVDPSLDDVGDVDNLVAVLDLVGGAVATVDLSRNCRYGDDVRTEILGEEGALLIDLLPTGRARLATAAGIEVVEGSETEDAVAAGVTAQAMAFAAAVGGAEMEIPGAAESARAVAIGRAVQEAAASGTAVAPAG